MTSLPHPFLHHPETLDIPEDMVADVDEIYKWICSQPRFPNYSKNHAYLFLHACLGDIPATKKALLKYIEIRASAPNIFDNRDLMLDEIQFVFNMTHLVALPKKTPEGCNILVYRIADSDPSKMHFANAVKAFCMFNDIQISDDCITAGYIVVFDMKGLRLGHLTRIQFGALRTFMAYIQEAHPVRLKKIYVVHSSFFVNQIMNLVKPLIKGELMSLLHFTAGGPSEVLPVELLPEDYGGPQPCLEKLHNEQRAHNEKTYREWLIDSAGLKEVCKEDQITNNNDIKIDEKSATTQKLADLQID